MGKSALLTVRLQPDLRKEIEQCAEEDQTTVSALCEDALKEFCNRRRRERARRRNLPKALRALAGISGCISHGRPTADIDDELYGARR